MMGVCVGHDCDHCSRCLGSATTKAHCCRGDNPDYVLPDMGAWRPFYGSLGVMNEAGDEQECHACGGWYRSLGTHVWRGHDLTDAEYRALFGLRRTEPLAGESVRNRARQLLRQWAGQNARANLAKINGATPERQLMLRTRPRRLQHQGRVLRRCAECAREFWTIEKHVRHHGARYCGPSCAGRSRKGERGSNAKHSTVMVAEIRRRYAEGGASQSQLAAEYGVTQPRISEMVLGRNWRVADAHLDLVQEPVRPQRWRTEEQKRRRREYKASRRAAGLSA